MSNYVVKTSYDANLITSKGTIRRTTARRGHRLSITALHLLFYYFLSTAYYYYLSDVYLSEGYNLDVNIHKIIYSILALTLFSLIIPNRSSLRYSLLHIMCAASLTPVLVFYSMGNKSNAFFLSFYTCILTVYAFSFFRFNPRSRLNFSKHRLMRFLFASVVLFILSLIWFGAGSYFNLDLATVYTFRRVIEDNLPPIYNYLIPIFTKVVLTFAVFLACREKKYAAIIACLGFGFVLFGLTSHKSVALYPLIVVAIYYAGRKYNPGLMFVVMAIVATLISLLDFATRFAGIWIGYLVSGRAFLVPALLNHHYFEFFSNNPWYWWSGSKLTLGLISMPYPQQAPSTIGIEVFNDPTLFANVGWFGSGYAQAGFAGALIYSILLGLIFAYFNACAKRIGNILPVVIVHTLTALNSGDLLTLLLTDGLVVLLLLLNTLGGTEARRISSPQTIRTKTEHYP